MTDFHERPLAQADEVQNPIDEVIRGRRTINKFQEQIPPTELIVNAIDAACWAPNHKLTEPWRYYFLGSESIQQVVELNCDLVAASKGEEVAAKKREKWSSIPGWLVITSQVSGNALRDKENYAAVCCALQNLALLLWDRGVGIKWTTGDVTRDERIYEILKIDRATEEIVGMIWYGYPAEVPVMKRRPVEEVISHRP